MMQRAMQTYRLIGHVNEEDTDTPTS